MKLPIAFAATAMVLLPLAAHGDITGAYEVVGRNADGSPYRGSATIEEQAGQYVVEWSVGQSYSGYGAVTGDIFIVNWGDVHPSFYLIMPDGELHGTWADGMALERMTPAPDAE